MNHARSLRIAVAGAGLIGARHIEHIAASKEAILSAIIDPAPEAAAIASRHGARHFSALEELIDKDKPDGVILATPNRLHVSQGVQALAAGIPTLVEKPIADDAEEARRLVDTAEASGVALLVGHHRRHNPLVARAKSFVDSGALGTIVSAHAFFWMMKPATYFDVRWRREPGGGPMLINFIHDIDLMRHFLGEVESVGAMQSNSIRGFPVDETSW